MLQIVGPGTRRETASDLCLAERTRETSPVKGLLVVGVLVFLALCV